MSKSIGSTLKKELKAKGYTIFSVKVGEKSTGYAFNQGTRYKTITIVSENPYDFDDSLIYNILIQTKLTINMFQAKSYTIIRKIKEIIENESQQNMQ